MSKQSKRLFLILLISLLGMMGLFFRTVRMTYADPDFARPGWDHHLYIQMATNNPFDLHVAPFGWRTLNPLLAKMFPFDLQMNFTILTVASLWLTAITTYFMLDRMGFSGPLSMAGMLFFLSLGWATRWNIRDFWLTDALSFLFVALCIWSILARKDLFFALVLALGITAKESVIFVAPLWYTLNSRSILDRKLLLRWLCLIAPAAVALLALRALIPAANAEYSAMNLLETIGKRRIQTFGLDALLEYTTGTFGLSLVILPFFSVRKSLHLAWRLSPFLALNYLSLLFAVNTERVLVAAFPALIMMALQGIRNIAAKTSTPEGFFILLPLSLLLLLLVKDAWYIVPAIYQGIILLAFAACSLQFELIAERMDILRRHVGAVLGRIRNRPLTQP